MKYEVTTALSMVVKRQQRLAEPTKRQETKCCDWLWLANFNASFECVFTIKQSLLHGELSTEKSGGFGGCAC